MAVRERGESDTRAQILDVAERLVQSRGFNAFSYGDVATELGITKPALHYHFASKAELGEALITRYAARFTEALSRIDRDRADGRAKLEAYVELYRQVLAQRRMCLCGMLAADYSTLPPAMRQGVIRFFDDNDTWLTHVVDEGRHDETMHVTGSSRDIARTIVAALEGAMLVARPSGDLARFDASAASLVGAFAPPVGTGRRTRR